MKLNIFAPSITKKKITRLVKRILKEEKSTIHVLNIIIADDSYMKKLNRTFLGKDRPTNVISFNMNEISEIYVSKGKAKSEDELHYYIVHGLLHIIGYDHRDRKESKIMETKCYTYSQFQ